MIIKSSDEMKLNVSFYLGPAPVVRNFVPLSCPRSGLASGSKQTTKSPQRPHFQPKLSPDL